MEEEVEGVGVGVEAGEEVLGEVQSQETDPTLKHSSPETPEARSLWKHRDVTAAVAHLTHCSVMALASVSAASEL